VDIIFHLAAQTFVPTSWSAPQETLTTNIIGQLNIFEAIRDAKISPLIQIAGSSEEYGLVRGKDIPIKETCPLSPLSPYAVSKIGQDYLGYQYFRSYGLKVVRTDGSRVSYGRSFLRYLAYYPSWLTLGIGFIVVALTRDKRGIHDFVCDTRVIKV